MMSEFKGTPGPWEIMNGGDILGPQGGDSGDGVKCDRDDGWQVAEVGIYATFVDGELMELGNGPRDANKKLIAAAPDLLEVLQEVQEFAQGWSQYEMPIGLDDRINAAIAKALGEDHAD